MRASNGRQERRQSGRCWIHRLSISGSTCCWQPHLHLVLFAFPVTLSTAFTVWTSEIFLASSWAALLPWDGESLHIQQERLGLPGLYLYVPAPSYKQKYKYGDLISDRLKSEEKPEWDFVFWVMKGKMMWAINMWWGNGSKRWNRRKTLTKCFRGCPCGDVLKTEAERREGQPPKILLTTCHRLRHEQTHTCMYTQIRARMNRDKNTGIFHFSDFHSHECHPCVHYIWT